MAEKVKEDGGLWRKLTRERRSNVGEKERSSEGRRETDCKV